MTRQSDVVIIGGGLAGLTLALQLRTDPASAQRDRARTAPAPGTRDDFQSRRVHGRGFFLVSPGSTGTR